MLLVATLGGGRLPAGPLVCRVDLQLFSPVGWRIVGRRCHGARSCRAQVVVAFLQRQQRQAQSIQVERPA